MDGPNKTTYEVSIEAKTIETSVIRIAPTSRRGIVLRVAMGEVLLPGSNRVVDVSAGMHTNEELRYLVAPADRSVDN